MILGFMIFGMIPIGIISLIIYGVIHHFQKKREGKRSLWCHFSRVVFIAYIMGLVYLTIFWGGLGMIGDYHLINLHPFIWLKETYAMGYDKMIEQLITNIFMFVPYGVLLPVVFSKMRKWWRTAAVVFATTFLIEFIQYFIGRSCDVDDLIMNFAGGCIGFGIYCLVKKVMTV